ncbi:MAG: 2-dehydro-3-deoxygalactonokinase [Paracoccaceae bacterium]
MRAAWIAVDWGTSHLRLWRMAASGALLDRVDDDRGMGRLTPAEFQPVLEELLTKDLKQGPLTVVCCGMAGSRQGWAEARYASVPCAPPGIGQATHLRLTEARLDVHILPGLSQAIPADVMRGEETQIAGFLAVQPEFDGVLCLPGTHCKWVHVSAGEVVSFKTVMTGEMFALLARQSVLRHSVAADGLDDTAFVGAVSRAMSRPEALVGDLFSLRAEALLAGLDGVVARSRLSGLLIGAELAAARAYWLGREVVILGESRLALAYQAALAAQGLAADCVNAEEMTLNGLRAAYAGVR